MAETTPPPEGVVMNWTAKGAVVLGVLGAAIGLVVGIADDRGWRVAWFAMMELGIPSFIVGGLIGALCGAAALASRRHRGVTDRA